MGKGGEHLLKWRLQWVCPQPRKHPTHPTSLQKLIKFQHSRKFNSGKQQKAEKDACSLWWHVAHPRPDMGRVKSVCFLYLQYSISPLCFSESRQCSTQFPSCPLLSNNWMGSTRLRGCDYSTVIQWVWGPSGDCNSGLLTYHCNHFTTWVDKLMWCRKANGHEAMDNCEFKALSFLPNHSSPAHC